MSDDVQPDVIIGPCGRVSDDHIAVDIAFHKLKVAGWSIGDMATGSRWTVTGDRGDHVIKASGDTQAEAWRIAALHAASVGTLADDPKAPGSLYFT